VVLIGTIFWGLSSLFTGCTSRICADGLVPVPNNAPDFCIQPFEAKIDEGGNVTAKKGQTPDIHISFEEAKRACSKSGLTLINHQEWMQSGGGGRYPWGDEYEEWCVLDSPKNHGKWKSVQPSGIMEGCVSEHGVYDQIGNAWEWVDLQQTASKEAWIEYLASQGHTAEVSQTLIQVSEGMLAKLQYNAVCVYMKSLQIEQELLTVELDKPIASDCLTAGQGYLWFQRRDADQGETIPEPGSLLPVKLWGNRIVWDKSRDGESVGAKVGGSFYSGGESTLQSFWVGHIPSFDGSIGFRCVQRLN